MAHLHYSTFVKHASVTRILNQATRHSPPERRGCLGTRLQLTLGVKKAPLIENVQEFENFAPAYLHDQTSYDFQTWIFFLSVLRATTYLVARGNG